MIADRGSKQTPRRAVLKWRGLPVGWLPVATLLFALLPIAGCGGKPTPPPPGGVKETQPPDVEMGGEETPQAAQGTTATPPPESPTEPDSAKDKP